MYKLYIFDFDGTLADSGGWMARMLNEAAARFDFRQVTDDEIEMLRGLSNREVVRFFGAPAWKMPAIANYVRRRMAEDADQIALFEGVGAMLAEVKARGARTAVVSSNSEANVRRILGEEAGLIDAYDCGAALFGKAAKFSKMMRLCGTTPPETLCIGDETRDIEAAKGAGAASAAVLWGYAKPEVLRAFEPTHLLEAMADIPRLARGTVPAEPG